MRYKLYYLVIDGGDGSSYTQFCESKELAKLKEKMEKESDYGFCDSCVSSVSVDSDSPVTIAKNNLLTPEEILEELDERIEDTPTNDNLFKIRKSLIEYMENRK